MLLKPNTRNDEKLFLAIVEFLSKLSESPEFEPVIKDLINEGKENLITMLNREQPDTGMDLLIRGHEKIGEFLKKMSTTIGQNTGQITSYAQDTYANRHYAPRHVFLDQL